MLKPSQNISCAVFVIKAWVTSCVAGSYVAVIVWIKLLPPNVLGLYELHTSRFPLDHSMVAETGTRGNSMVGPHAPYVTGEGGRPPSAV